MKFFALILIFAALNLSCAGDGRRKDPKERLLMAKFKVEHLYHCTSCASHMAEVLSKARGVYRASAITKEDAAIVFYEVGRTDIDELLAELHRHEFNAKLVLGPVARAADGRPERYLDYEIPKKKPTLKEIWAERARERNGEHKAIAHAAPAVVPKKVVAPKKVAAPEPTPLPAPLIDEKPPVDLAPTDLNMEAPAQEEFPKGLE